MNIIGLNKKVVWFTGSLTGVLLIILCSEYFYAVHTQQELLTVRPQPNATQVHYEMPSVDLQERSEDAFDDMVNRPLFLEGRRPSKALTAEQLKANVVSTGKFDWVLNGIYTSKRGVSGLFTRTLKNVPKDNYRRVRVEEALDGWVLTEILNDKVVLTQNGMSKELLLRKAKAKSSATKNGQGEQATVTNPVGVVVPSENSEDINNESLEEPIENSDNEDF